jgi:hypothetical protein
VKYLGEILIVSRQCLLQFDAALLNCYHINSCRSKSIGHISFLFLGTLIINYDLAGCYSTRQDTAPDVACVAVAYGVDPSRNMFIEGFED